MKALFFSALILALNSTCGLFADEQKAPEEVFTHIYQNAVWGVDEKGEGTSGPGSTVANTKEYMEYLQDFLKEKKITSVVDLGCGDWQFSQHINWNGVQYTGFDVVLPIIERNKAKFSQPNIAFMHGDGITTDLPAADLLICKDVLQHLTEADIKKIAAQFPKFKYCLITNGIDADTLSSNNHPISRGDYRTLDIRKPPFNIKAKKVLTYRGPFMNQVLLVERE